MSLPGWFRILSWNFRMRTPVYNFHLIQFTGILENLRESAKIFYIPGPKNFNPEQSSPMATDIIFTGTSAPVPGSISGLISIPEPASAIHRLGLRPQMRKGSLVPSKSNRKKKRPSMPSLPGAISIGTFYVSLSVYNFYHQSF